MRWLMIISLAAGFIAGGCEEAFAHTPFEPRADAPDHVVTMMGTDGVQTVQSRIVTHRGEWTRVETEQDGRRRTQYFKRNEATTVRIYHGRADEYFLITVILGPERLSLWDYEPTRTTERKTLLGESCTVWEVLRPRHPSGVLLKLTRLSCVTDDGVELWYQVASGSHLYSSAEAIRIERRAVSLADAQPPRNLLALDWWSEPPSAAEAGSPEFEVVMHSSGDDSAPRATRVVRQRGGWRYTEDMAGGSTRGRLTINNAARGLGLRLEIDGTSAPKQLLLSRAPSPDPARSVVRMMTPQAQGKRESVLGETCEWFDMTPGMADAGRAACRTRDGISLKETSWSRSLPNTTFSAVQFVRRPVALSEVMPPASVLDPKTWGLPD